MIEVSENAKTAARSRLDGRKGMIGLGLIAVGGIFVVWLLWSAVCGALDSTVTFQVVDKWVKRYDSTDVYLVSVRYEDGTEEVLKDSDSTLYWKYNSSDVYAKLEKDHTYTAKVFGTRWEWMSWYRNIVSTPVRAKD